MFKRAMLSGEVVDYEVRADQRTLVGLIVPFNEPTPINEWGVRYTESFAPGAFAAAEANPRKVKFLGQHDRESFPLGVTVALRSDARGEIGEFKLSKTQRSDEALELARDGAVDGFSVGFSSVVPAMSTPIRPGSHVVREKVALSEVSLVTFPAYESARLDEIRSLGESLAVVEFMERVGKTHSAETLAELRKVLEALAASGESMESAVSVLSGIVGAEKDAPKDFQGPPLRSAVQLADYVARIPGAILPRR